MTPPPENKSVLKIEKHAPRFGGAGIYTQVNNL